MIISLQYDCYIRYAQIEFNVIFLILWLVYITYGFRYLTFCDQVWFVSGQMGMWWEEGFAVCLKHLYRHVLGVTEKEHVSVRFVSGWSEAWILDLPKAKQGVLGVFDRNNGDIQNFLMSVAWTIRCWIISSPESPHRVWGPRSLQFNGCRARYLGAKRPAREGDFCPCRGMHSDTFCV
jgi:hypothetical protein